MEAAQQIADKKMKRLLFLANAGLLIFGSCVAPMVMRLYYLHGGKRVWLESALETGGWPIMFIPLFFTYLQRRRKAGPKAELFVMTSPVFVAAALIGSLTGIDDYLYSYGVKFLPVSTSALIIASQLGFTAVFAFILVKQKFTSYTINAVVLLTLGPGVLAMHAGNDRPKGESNSSYFLGFFLTLGAAVLYGLILPLVELLYKKAKQAITYNLVLEIQLVMSFFATLVCTIGMIANKDFQAIPKEAKAFGLGEATYYVVLVLSAIAWQTWFLGAIGVIFSGSSLLSAIFIAGLLPVTEILGVIFYKEKFEAEKGISLVLSLWGSVSYFYGEYKHSKEAEKMISKTKNPETEIMALSNGDTSIEIIARNVGHE